MQVIADSEAHAGLLGAILTNGCSRFQADFGELAITLILIEVIRSGIVIDENVLPAGVVEINPGHAQSVIAVGIVDSGTLRDVGKSSIAVVVKKCVAVSGKTAGTTLHVHAAILAGGNASEAGKFVEMKADVVGHHQIDKTVVVVVTESRALRVSAVGDTENRLGSETGFVHIHDRRRVFRGTEPAVMEPHAVDPFDEG